MYKFSPKYIKNRYKKMIYIFIFLCILFFVMSFNRDNNGNALLFTFLISMAIYLKVIYDAMQQVKLAKKHYIELTKIGLKSYNNGIFQVIPWSQVVSVQQKFKQGDLKKITLKMQTFSWDLSNYEALEKLSSELKQYLSTKIWKD